MKIQSVIVGPLETNCYTVSDENKNAVIIDPGFEENKILSIINQNDYIVKYIFLTHGHFDHLMAVSKIVEKTNAKTVICYGDEEYLLKPDLSLLGFLGETMPKIAAADIIIKDSEKIIVSNLTFKFISTPGHTPGSCCILCENALFSGDTLFAGNAGRTDLPGGNYNDLLKSFKKLFALSENYNVYPGHYESTTLDEQKKTNPYFKG